VISSLLRVVCDRAVVVRWPRVASGDEEAGGRRRSCPRRTRWWKSAPRTRWSRGRSRAAPSWCGNPSSSRATSSPSTSSTATSPPSCASSTPTYVHTLLTPSPMFVSCDLLLDRTYLFSCSSHRSIFRILFSCLFRLAVGKLSLSRPGYFCLF
jgi:hypothetical protein